MNQHEKRLSKFLSLILRHRAKQYGIVVDPGTGYADLDEVETVCAQRFRRPLTRKDILEVVAHSPDGKQRFEVVGRRIRALYGHSQVELEYAAIEPPEFLYHGTSPGRADSILVEGLKGMARQYVHLADNVGYARQVGGRHCPQPTIVRVRAAEAARAGVQFFCPDGVHFLARTVPPEWLDRLEDVRERER